MIISEFVFAVRRPTSQILGAYITTTDRRMRVACAARHTKEISAQNPRRVKRQSFPNQRLICLVTGGMTFTRRCRTLRAHVDHQRSSRSQDSTPRTERETAVGRAHLLKSRSRTSAAGNGHPRRARCHLQQIPSWSLDAERSGRELHLYTTAPAEQTISLMIAIE